MLMDNKLAKFKKAANDMFGGFFMRKSYQIPLFKICKCCEHERNYLEYAKSPKEKDGREYTCKICKNLRRENNKEMVNSKQRENYMRNRVNRLKTAKEYNLKHRETRLLKRRLWWQKNQERLNLKQRNKARSPEVKERQRKYMAKRKTEDPIFALSQTIRSNTRTALKRHLLKKSMKTVELLGCSIENLKLSLESQFEPWMNWENHGNYNLKKKTWEIDHRIPCDAFDLSKLEHQRACFHWSNLKPLDAKENRDKWYYLPDNFNLDEFVLFSPGNNSPEAYLAEMWS